MNSLGAETANRLLAWYFGTIKELVSALEKTEPYLAKMVAEEVNTAIPPSVPMKRNRALIDRVKSELKLS